MLRRVPASLSVRGRTCSSLLISTRTTKCSTLSSPIHSRRLPTISARGMASSSFPTFSTPLSASLPSDSFQLLSESDKAGGYEDALYEQQIKDVEAWWATPRYAGIKRPYTAADVVSKRGSLQQSYPSSVMARKLWNLVQERLSRGEPLHTSMPQSSLRLISRLYDPDRALPCQWVPSTPSR